MIAMASLALQSLCRIIRDKVWPRQHIEIGDLAWILAGAKLRGLNFPKDAHECDQQIRDVLRPLNFTPIDMPAGWTLEYEEYPGFATLAQVTIRPPAPKFSAKRAASVRRTART